MRFTVFCKFCFLFGDLTSNLLGYMNKNQALWRKFVWGDSLNVNDVMPFLMEDV